ncbi:MAG: pyruvate kinase [Thermodesulfovibrionales bacterium]
MRKAKIVCTIGPASNKRAVIFSLIRNGMDVARLNFSHGDHESHGRAIALIREGAVRYGRPVAILQDLQGIKIRVGLIRGGSVFLKKGSEVLVLPGDGVGDEKSIYISYPAIVRDAKKGDRILLDDGLIHLEVTAKVRGALKARVIEGGILKDRKGVNLPFRVSMPAFTQKDALDLDFGLRMGVDYVALSFVRKAADIIEVKDWLKKKGLSIPLIAKIEKPEALDNIESILDEVEGIMIARGDLGVEVSPEEVPVIQKRLIGLSNRKGKIVITATQMLESMTEKMRPTRAEATDVANAVIDGSDALMLSAETASGKFPLKALMMMDKIVEYTEKQYPATLSPFKVQEFRPAGFSEAIADAAVRAAEDIKAKFIIAFTHSGFTARLVSKFRPETPIIAFTPDGHVQRKMSIYWGVQPKLMRSLSSTDEMIQEVERSLLSEGLARRGERIVITASTPILGSGKTNLLKLHTIGE